MDPVYSEVVEIALDLQQVRRETQALADQYSVAFGDIKKGWKEVLAAQQSEVKAGLKMESEAQKIRASMYKDEQNERIRREEIVHRQIMKMREQEAQATAAASSGTGGLTVGRGLRIGAGVAGTFGNFQLASAAYAGERIAQVMGIANTAMGATALAAAGASAAVVGLGVAFAGVMKYGNDLNDALASMSTFMHDGAKGSTEFTTALNGLALSATVLSTKFDRDIMRLYAK